MRRRRDVDGRRVEPIGGSAKRAGEQAVVNALSRTGRLVTSAAIILCISFASITLTPNIDIRVLAFGLAAGILLDATVIRSLLVPALVALFGHWNWWMPARLERALRVAPALAAD